MTLLVTDALVLHVADYLESSRILRLLTREAGVQSVLARGARNSRKRFGSALDHYASGQASLQLKPGRDLHTLQSFDVQRARTAIGDDLTRFTSAAVISECVLRVVHDDTAGAVYDVVIDAFDRITTTSREQIMTQSIASIWRIVAEVGVAPALDICALCHTPLDDDAELMFSHQAGGVLCANCASRARGGRRLPASARAAIRAWLAGADTAPLSGGETRAHQRLVREFISHHLADTSGLKAWAIWEQG